MENNSLTQILHKMWGQMVMSKFLSSSCATAEHLNSMIKKFFSLWVKLVETHQPCSSPSSVPTDAAWEDVSAKVPGQESREAPPVRLFEHQEVPAHLLRDVHWQALLRAQQVAHGHRGLQVQERRQRQVEDAVDHLVRLPEEVRRPGGHVLRAVPAVSLLRALQSASRRDGPTKTNESLGCPWPALGNRMSSFLKLHLPWIYGLCKTAQGAQLSPCICAAGSPWRENKAAIQPCFWGVLGHAIKHVNWLYWPCTLLTSKTCVKNTLKQIFPQMSKSAILIT